MKAQEDGATDPKPEPPIPGIVDTTLELLVSFGELNTAAKGLTGVEPTIPPALVPSVINAIRGAG